MALDSRRHRQGGRHFIPEVKEITPEIEAMAGRPVSGVGSGGMDQKN